MKADAHCLPSAPPSDTGSPRVWATVVVTLCYVLLMTWLALRTRVYIDEIWDIEWGRIRLDPLSSFSMYMFADGSSLRLVVDAGPLLADWLFRTFQSVSAFRLVNVAAMLVLVWAVRALAATHGVQPRIAWWLSLLLLIDPTLMQSVSLGRPDALALAACVGGVWLADRGIHRVASGGKGWLLVALGYSLCVASISIWISVALMGPLVLVHWLAGLARLRQAADAGVRLSICFLLAPILTLLLTLDLGHAWDVWRAHSEDPIFPTQSNVRELWRAPELMAVSCFILLPGLLAMPFIRPRWVGAVLLLGLGPILLSGFYTFRIPYLLIYAVAAIVLVVARTADEARLGAWRRLLTTGVLVSAALAIIRLGFSLQNEQRPLPGMTLLKALPPGTKVADFSWDFYETGRPAGLLMMRSYPAMEGSRVQQWLTVARPDVVIRAVESLGTWILVDDLDSKLRDAGYCELGWFDVRGEPWTQARKVRPVPSPLLWRLGLFRDHGPYTVWQPCTVRGL